MGTLIWPCQRRVCYIVIFIRYPSACLYVVLRSMGMWRGGEKDKKACRQLYYKVNALMSVPVDLECYATPSQ